MVVKVFSAVLLALTFLAAPANAAELRPVTGFGSNPGALQMFEYVPDGLAAGQPVVVALHGCTQDASYSHNAGWTGLADSLKFTLVLPQQTTGNNINKCFNWFQASGSNEAESIAQMARRAIADTNADPRRVYVTGLSAGGAMTSVMLAKYPDLFAGGGVVAGIPYGCAAAIFEAFTCMNPGLNLTPQQWGDKVRAASSTVVRPGVSIWHGTADYTVAPANLRESSEQWTNVGARVETRTIQGMGHGQPVAPGCGRAGPYILDVGVCAAAEIARFWGIQ
ncbi:PHB depolymerase family esterase [Kibdelosporangium philippinense]|uniref:PHB depolymerase family esterase n=1 Tax=Kibdelosporangium philippinense TaxID=211113 RepID=A0ABS8ZTW9_9PSEU|nr:PHB depolymerase family esterase [Kibdelosporangium philippinense]MCE7011047.1 PHB depolymerase family esterase [Kibdelosporangium philippinense]